MNYPEVDYITSPEVTLISTHNLTVDSHPEQPVKLLIRVSRPAASVVYALFNGRNGTVVHDLDCEDLVFMIPELDDELTMEEQQLAIDEMGSVYEEAFSAYNYLLELGIPTGQAELVLPNGLTTPLHMTIPMMAFKKFVELDLPFWNGELQQISTEFKLIYMRLFPELNLHWAVV
jgi:hypothetical protein